jgi:hypothetical protein
MARLTTERTPDQLGQEWFVERLGAEAIQYAGEPFARR